jgi:PadR family transcriptional regulator PadR
MDQGSIRGRLDAMLLAVIEDGPLHGYAVIEALSARSDGDIDLPTGTVYPALRRMERAGWLDGEWSEAGGRRRRVYTLTDAGSQALHQQRADWQHFAARIAGVLTPAETPSPT